MPQFRFRVLTPDGRVRKGSLTGASLEDARRQIESMGLSVVELAPLDDVPQLAPRKTVSVPGWSQGLVGYPLAACLAALGLVWGLLTWRANPAQRSTRAAVRDASKMAEECQFSGQFEGRLVGGPLPQEATLVLQFPEIPYQVSQPWTNQPSCHISVKFKAARRPSLCQVRLQKGRSVLAESKIEPLVEGQNPFELELKETR